MCIVTPIALRSDTWSTGLITSRPRSYPAPRSALALAKGGFVPQIWTAWLRVRNGAPPVLAELLTSNTRSFQTGVPSFDMGAEGADKPLEAMSSFSVGSTGSFRLRIFLIDTTQVGFVSGRATARWPR